MKRLHFGIAAIFGLVLGLAACGGGDGGSGTEPSTDVYQLGNAWVGYVNESSTKPFTISGSIEGVGVTGSGTLTYGQLVSATFESRAALSKTMVATGTVSAMGQSAPYGASATSYYDSKYLPLGASSNVGYAVVSGTAVIPQTARVNDTGTVATTIVYADSSKATVVGTSTTTYALLPDTSATALLKIVETSKNQDGSMAGMAVSTYRMTPAGALTHLTEEMTAGTVTLTLTF